MIAAAPDLGCGWFYLHWNKDLEPGEKYHVGCTFKKNQNIKRGAEKWFLASGDSTDAYMVSYELYVRPCSGLTLSISNLSSDSVVTISGLQCVVTSDSLDLDSLYWGNAALESLNWEDVASTPFSIQPGGDTLFQIDKELVPPDNWALMRAKSGHSLPYDSRQLVSQESTNSFLFGTADLPTFSEWGLIILPVLLGVAGIILIRRRGRAVAV
jgi:hypothetical protein